jgi:hypothetical protein
LKRIPTVRSSNHSIDAIIYTSQCQLALAKAPAGQDQKSIPKVDLREEIFVWSFTY